MKKWVDKDCEKLIMVLMCARLLMYAFMFYSQTNLQGV